MDHKLAEFSQKMKHAGRLPASGKGFASPKT
jgi:hypothetical protein